MPPNVALREARYAGPARRTRGAPRRHAASRPDGRALEPGALGVTHPTSLSMPPSLTLRLTVRRPVPGVLLRVQRGRDALVPPVDASSDAVTFELQVDADARADGRVVCRGPEVQGPPAGRFVYVNAGTYAGQADAAVGRRAKVSLSGLSAAVVAAALARPGAVVAATIDGRARDGGPATASVPLLGGGWEVAPE